MMKRSKFFVPLITSTVIASTMPLSILSSCGAKYNKQTDEVFDQSVDLFMGTKEQPGVCSVPHASFDLDQIRNLITSIVTNVGYEVKHDWYGNIWWDIPASQGCENWKPLVLQAHMDMVWTEAKNSDNDEPKAPKPVIDTVNGEKVIHTENYASSLGADNGAGVAVILALTLNKNVNHGKLRCIITADEEPGMVGASYIGYMDEPTGEDDKRDINVVDHSEGWDYALNIDGENDHDIYVSCAGGYSYEYIVDKIGTEPFPDGAHCWKLIVDGCQGGHSGLAVANNHCNSIKVAVDIMGFINNYLENSHKPHARLSSINSFENATNVVPNKTEIVFASGLDESVDKINDYLKSVIYAYKQVYPAETGLNIRVEKVSTPPSSIIKNVEDSDTILNFIDYFIYGVVSRDATNRVIASSNICPVTLDLSKDGSKGKEQFVAKIYSRSEDRSLLSSFADIAETNFALLEGRIEHDGTNAVSNKIAQYEPWDYKEKDPVRDLAIKSFKKVGIKPTESKIHGGVECSWWYLLNPEIHQTAIGPTIDDVHDPKEKLHLDSYKRYVSIILDVIAGMQNI